MPIHINARRRLKKYLKDKLVTNVIMYMKKIRATDWLKTSLFSCNTNAN